MGIQQYQKAVLNLQRRWGDKFVEPEASNQQKIWFGDMRVEVVSPSGYTRRGTISITTGWQPSLMLIHRRGSSGSWDLLHENDIIVAAITKRSQRIEVAHDKLEVAVYQAHNQENAA